MQETKHFKICYSYLPVGETMRFYKIEIVEAESIITALFILGAGVKGNDCNMEADPDYSPVFHLNSNVEVEWCYEITEERRLLTIVTENDNGKDLAKP